jgi:hypothetical protein
MVATAEPGAADADDGSEHDLPHSEDQRKNRKTPQGAHNTAHAPIIASARLKSEDAADGGSTARHVK